MLSLERRTRMSGSKLRTDAVTINNAPTSNGIRGINPPKSDAATRNNNRIDKEMTAQQTRQRDLMSKYDPKSYQRFAPGPTDTGSIAGVLKSTPAKLYKDSMEEDEMYRLRRMVASNPGHFGHLLADDTELNYIKDKYEQSERAQFEKWMLSEVEQLDPYSAQVVLSKYPELFKKRHEWAKNVQEIQKKLFMMKLKPITDYTDEDWAFKYEIYRGNIKPDDYKHAIFDTASIGDDIDESHKSGIFNVRGWIWRQKDPKYAPGLATAWLGSDGKPLPGRAFEKLPNRDEVYYPGNDVPNDFAQMYPSRRRR